MSSLLVIASIVTTLHGIPKECRTSVTELGAADFYTRELVVIAKSSSEGASGENGASTDTLVGPIYGDGTVRTVAVCVDGATADRLAEVTLTRPSMRTTSRPIGLVIPVDSATTAAWLLFEDDDRALQKSEQLVLDLSSLNVGDSDVTFGETGAIPKAAPCGDLVSTEHGLETDRPSELKCGLGVSFSLLMDRNAIGDCRIPLESPMVHVTETHSGDAYGSHVSWGDASRELCEVRVIALSGRDRDVRIEGVRGVAGGGVVDLSFLTYKYHPPRSGHLSSAFLRVAVLFLLLATPIVASVVLRLRGRQRLR